MPSSIISLFYLCTDYIYGYPYRLLHQSSTESTLIIEKNIVDFGALCFLAKHKVFPICTSIDHHIENYNIQVLLFCKKYNIHIYLKKIYRRHQQCIIWAWNHGIQIYGKLSYGYLNSHHQPECEEILPFIQPILCKHCSIITHCPCRSLHCYTCNK